MPNLDPENLKLWGGIAIALLGMFSFTDKGSSVASSLLAKVKSIFSGGSTPVPSPVMPSLKSDEDVLHCALELGKYFDSKNDIDGKKYAARIGTYVFERYVNPTPSAPITQ